jgi:excinuclease ABC subunit C
VSELDTIIGIGKIIKEKLLQKYKSVKRIKEASKEEIAGLIGKKKAEILMNGLGMKN